MDYKDFWLRIERRDEGFWVTSRSPAGGETSAPLTLPPNLERYQLSTLTGRVRGEAPQAAQRNIALGEAAPNPDHVGAELFQALFAGPTRDAFNRNWGSGKEGGVRIRIQTDLNDPELAKLASLPWELLYNDGTQTALGRSKLTPIVRYLDVPLSYEPYPFEGPLRVLIVLANPEGTHPLDLAKERASIERTWGRLDGVQVTLIEQATSTAMFDKLDTGTYHVLHYMGHGGFSPEGGGVLFLEDEEGHAAPLPGRLLGETLREMPSIRLVVLNACDTGKTSHASGLDPFSGLASALVMAGVPAVVAMQVPVADRAAVAFAEKFYAQLAHGLPVDTAVAMGRRAIHRTDPASLEWATPVLFMRAPDGHLFTANTAAAASSTAAGAAPLLPRPDPSADGLQTGEGTPASVVPSPIAPVRWQRIAALAGLATLLAVVLIVWPDEPDDVPAPPPDYGTVAPPAHPGGPPPSSTSDARPVLVDTTDRPLPSTPSPVTPTRTYPNTTIPTAGPRNLSASPTNPDSSRLPSLQPLAQAHRDESIQEYVERLAAWGEAIAEWASAAEKQRERNEAFARQMEESRDAYALVYEEYERQLAEWSPGEPRPVEPPPPPPPPPPPRIPPPPPEPLPPFVCELDELNTAWFAYGDHSLSVDTRGRYDENIEALREHPDCALVLDGYTDGSEFDRFGAPLAARRAQAVYDYHLAHGIEADRMHIRVQGASFPSCDKDDPEAGCRQARRVESFPIHVDLMGELFSEPEE